MSKLYTIDVTQEDIDRGIRGSARACPVALALQRILGPRVKAFVTTVEIPKWFFFTQEIPAPKEARRWMVDFDTHRPVKPFSFVVEV